MSQNDMKRKTMDELLQEVNKLNLDILSGYLNFL